MASTISSSSDGASRYGQSLRGAAESWPMVSSGTAGRSQLVVPPDNARTQPSSSQSTTAKVCASSSPLTRATRTEASPLSSPRTQTAAAPG